MKTKQKFSNFTFLLLWLAAALALPAKADNPPPSQLYYIPFPEDQQLAAFQAISTVAQNPLNLFVTIAAASDNSIIYYDHWEDGYETDISEPVQATTEIWGDGNPANGHPPGIPTDRIMAGTKITLRNFIDVNTRQAVIDFDAGDKFGATKSIAVTRTIYPQGTNTLLAGSVEVLDTTLWGVEYRCPVGEDIPDAIDGQVFEYTGLVIMAHTDGTQVQIDADNNGAFETTITLNEGESHLVHGGVNVGGHVLASEPVQVVLFTGDRNSSYASRDTTLLPVSRWSSDYYAPVSTRSQDGTVVWLYNPGASAITVNYDRRNDAGSYTSANVSVPAGSYARVVLLQNYAYRFYTNGSGAPHFYAFATIDAQSSTPGDNSAYDGGYALIPEPWLTTQVLVGIGIGRDPFSATNPNENGNPIWVTVKGNGHTPVRVYVDYNGDLFGSLTDINGNAYDAHFDVRELDQLKLYDPDGDQSGMVIYTLDPNVRIAAAWAQEPGVASVAQPGIDVATGVPPLMSADGGKIANLSIDRDGDGQPGPGDRLAYDILINNTSRAPISGPFTVTDNLPADTVYVPGSARYRISISGDWGAWIPILDAVTGTPFPLDEGGFDIETTLDFGQQIQVNFMADVDEFADLDPGRARIINTGSIDVMTYVLSIPLYWSTPLRGSIGDRVWEDLNGDGVQDPGEPGINGVVVFADLNGNGVRDPGEPWDTTAGDGNYLLTGSALVAGTYTVRVDPASLAAVNPGYGPTYDLDGILTYHGAIVTLAGGEDRTDADFGYRIGASVGDRVWLDRDNDGVQENGEPGINGVRVYLDLNNDDVFTSGEPYAITAGDGSYYIGGLDTGTYTVRVDITTLPAGAVQTYDLNGLGTPHEASVTFIGAENRSDFDFGYRGTLSLGDLVWNDVDGNGVVTTYNVIDGRIDINNSGSVNSSDDGFINGVQIIDGRVDINGSGTITNADDGVFLGITVIDGNLDMNGNGSITNADDGVIAAEFGIANVRVYIDSNNNGAFDPTEPSAVTNGSGAYSIGNLTNGTYIMRVDPSTLPPSQAQTYDLDGLASPHRVTVTLSGSSRTDADFGYRDDATLGDRVWNDMNNNGVQDPGEPGIPGVLVYIDSGVNNNIYDPGEPYAITDVNGYYLITNLGAATHEVRIDISTLPLGSVQTYDLDGIGTPHVANVSLTATQDRTDADFGYRSNASIGDRIWEDSNGDGVQDPGETGVDGVLVFLDINGNGILDANEPSATTSGNGGYSFSGLVAGNYLVCVDPSTLPAGMVPTYDLNGPKDHKATATLAANQTRTDLDFGYATPAAIGDFVWNDYNANGIQDPGEPGLNAVEVTLFRANNTIVGSTVTAADGAYSFTDLMPGEYYLVFSTPAGFERSPADQIGDTEDSDANPANGRTPNFVLASGDDISHLDAGFFQYGSISGFVLADTDNDDLGDAPIAGVTLTLKDGNGDDIDSDPDTPGVQPTIAVTDAAGAYSFGNLLPGDYRVMQTQPAGYFSVIDVDGGDPNVIGDVIPISLAPGGSITGQNFIEEQPGSISGLVLADTTGDSIGDTPLPAIFINLKDGNGNTVATTFTDTNGAYSFLNLSPGSYSIEQDQPPGYASLSDIDGGNLDIIGDISPIILTAGAVITGQNFVETQYALIRGAVLADLDGDNNPDAPLPNVTITLKDQNGDVVATTTTDAAGFYEFLDLLAGTYTIEQTQPSGFSSLSDVDGGDLDIIGDVTPIVLLPGEELNNQNFVEALNGSIQGSVTADVNGDTTGDVPLGGVTITLLDSNGDPVATTTTDASGFYEFPDLAPGDYTVVEADPAGYRSVTPNSVPVTLIAGDIATADFVDEQLGSISGTIYAETLGGAPMESVLVELLDQTGSPVLDGDNNPIATLTAADGTYSFTGVPAGVYQVRQTVPSGYTAVEDADGSDLTLNGDVTPIVVTAGNDTVNQDFVNAAVADLAIAKLVDNETPNVGEEVTFTLVASNYGPSDATGVSVIDALPTGYTFVSADPSADYNDGTGIWTIGALANGDTATLTITATVNAAGDYLNTATITGNELDPDFDNNEDDAGTTPIPLGAISGAVTRDIDNDDLGDEPLEGVTITLLDSNGDTVVTTMTDAAGFYEFPSLVPGDYTVVQTDLAGYQSVTPNSVPVTVIADQTSTVDFVDEQLGAISGTVTRDIDNDDLGDEPLEGVIITLLDSNGDTVATTMTDADGFYEFPGLAPGDYTVEQTDLTGYHSITPNSVPATVIAGETATVDFVDEQLAGISGYVLADITNDATGELPISGVTLTLLDGDGNPLATTTTDANGYYEFPDLAPGTYRVAQSQPAGYFSVADADGGDLDLIGDVSPIVLLAGIPSTDNTFVERAAPGYIYNAITGEIVGGGSVSVSGPGPVIIIQDGSTGAYSFVLDPDNAIAGSYTITLTPPAGFVIDPTRPVAGPSYDPTGGPNPTVLGSAESLGSLTDFSAPANPYYLVLDLELGDPLVIHNNLPLVPAKANTWPIWQYLNPLDGENEPGDNPDDDRYDNLQEFAFGFDPATGVKSVCPIQVVTDPATGRVDVRVLRLTCISGVNYILEAVTTLDASPAGWSDVTTITPVITYNPDGTEWATYENVAVLAPASTTGFFRVRIELDADLNGVPEAISRTEVAGAASRVFATPCETFSLPFLKCEIFSGTAGAVGGSVIDITAGAGDGDFAGALTSGAQYYVEVIAGDYEGHRFEVDEAQSTATSIAIDLASPRNTLPALPAGLAGAPIAARPHYTLDQVFDKTLLTASNNPSTADRVQFHNGSGFSAYWLFLNGGNPRWVRMGDATLTDYGHRVIAPGEGVFVQIKNGAAALTWSGYVRSNDFALPLAASANFIGGGWPLDQSPAARAMTAANGFTGSANPALADKLQLWKGDSEPNASGYAAYFFLLTGSYNQWTSQQNAALANQNNTLLLHSLRAGFIFSRSGNASYVMPMPWTP